MAQANGKPVQLGENVSGVLEGSVLVLRIDLATDLGPSRSGKTRLVATTRRAVEVDARGTRLNLNLYR